MHHPVQPQKCLRAIPPSALHSFACSVASPCIPPCTPNSSVCNDPTVLHPLCLPALHLSMQHPLNAQIPLHAMSYTPPHAAPLCFASVQHSLQPLTPLHATTQWSHISASHNPPSCSIPPLLCFESPHTPPTASPYNYPCNIPHTLLHAAPSACNIPCIHQFFSIQNSMHPQILLHATSQWSCTLHPFTSLHPGTPLLGLFVQRPVHPQIYLHAKSQ